MFWFARFCRIPLTISFQESCQKRSKNTVLKERRRRASPKPQSSFFCCSSFLTEISDSFGWKKVSVLYQILKTHQNFFTRPSCFVDCQKNNFGRNFKLLSFGEEAEEDEEEVNQVTEVRTRAVLSVRTTYHYANRSFSWMHSFLFGPLITQSLKGVLHRVNIVEPGVLLALKVWCIHCLLRFPLNEVFTQWRKICEIYRVWKEKERAAMTC